MAPRLEVIRGENVGETYKVKLKTRIGRERDNDVILLDPNISRYHAQISMEGGQWTLTDLGSSNHTYLNGNVVSEPTALRPGDRISLGTTEMVLRLPGTVAGDTAPRPVAAAAASLPQPAGVRALPRLAWVAGAFVLLLLLVAVAVIGYQASRGPAEEAGGPGTPPAVADSSNTPASDSAAPLNMTLVYEDNFEDSSSGWDDTSDPHTLKRYGNNRYQIEISTSNLVAWGLANRDVADFEIEVEAKLEDGAESNSYGLIFRFQDRENFYRFDISGDGYFLLSKFVKGEWVTLVDWTPSEYIKKGLAANTLKVTAVGPDITVWANGQKLATVKDDSLSHGNFGFFAGTFSEPYFWSSYDNLKLWVPTGKEQEITLIPTATRPPAVPPTPPPPPSPTSNPPTLPAAEQTATPEVQPTVTMTEQAVAAVTPTVTPSATPTSEPTPTPVPLPDYASRDQTLGRGEAEVTGRIIFPVYDPERGTYDIYIADAANGDNRTLVQKNASQPALNLDGTQLAYRSWTPDQRGLFARPLSGGDAWNFNPFFESARPQFSPVDNSLMYHSRVGGREPAIYRVINGVGEVMRREGFPIQGEAAKWLPDAQSFVYSSCLGGKCGIIRSGMDGTNPILLSDHPSDTNAEVSPDGSTVVFMSKRGGNWEIYKVGIDGGTITALTSDNASEGLPTWSPDGQKIAFVSDRDGEWSAWDMDPDGTNQRRLFALGGSVDGQVQHDLANSRGWVEENIDWVP